MENKKTARGEIKYHPLAAFILLCLIGEAQAASGNLNKVAASTAHGVTIIDINKANDKGISHNIYDKFNVDKNGLIFNNSQTAVTTKLAGEIKGNSQLTSGAARVILNEVTSKNQSALQGLLEVAGSKAHLIIANPNGISCQGCGFINTEKVTITTGKPDMQNGALHGYKVAGGVVTLNGMETASPTEILARAVNVKGNLYADELAVVAGNNYIDLNGNITGTVKAQGNRPAWGIDTSALGGMYANKISLIGNEKGVGVRNSGIIAGTAEIKIDSSGKLINNQGLIKSAGQITLKTQNGLENVTGKINTNDTLAIDTHNSEINNSQTGSIAAKNDLYIDSGALSNVNGKIAAGGTLAINTHKSTLTNRGKGDTAGMHAAVMALQTGTLDNQQGLLKGHYVGIEASSIDNGNGTMESTGDTDILSAGNINNIQGLMRSTAGHMHLAAEKSTVNNANTKTADTFSGDSKGIIAGEGGIQIKAASLNNRTGQIASKGDISFSSSGGIDNYQGKLTGDKTLSIHAASLMNGQAGISSRQDIHIELEKEFSNSIGIINSDEGNVELQAKRVNNKGGLLVGQDVTITAQSTVDNSAALLVANKHLVIKTPGQVDNRNSNDFGRDYGFYLAMPNQPGGIIGREGIQIQASSVNNENSRIVAEFGALNITATDKINNSGSRIVANAGSSSLHAQAINNDYGIINSKDSISLDVGSLSNQGGGSVVNNNASGIISADNNLMLNIGTTFTNYGWISSKQNTTLKVAGQLSNRHIINADRALLINTQSHLYNFKDIAAGDTLSMTVNGDIKNTLNSNIKAGTVNLDAKGSVVNNSNVMATEGLMVSALGNIYNYSNMFSYGRASLTGKNIANNGSAALLGGNAGTTLRAGIVLNSGFLVGL